MDEAAWLEGDDAYGMLRFVAARATSRQLRLVGCAVCRRTPKHWQHARQLLIAIETAERYADGTATSSELSAAVNMLDCLHGEIDLIEALSCRAR